MPWHQPCIYTGTHKEGSWRNLAVKWKPDQHVDDTLHATIKSTKPFKPPRPSGQRPHGTHAKLPEQANGAPAEAECVTLQIDWKISFNTVRRYRMLAAVAERCPALLPVAAWAYGRHSRLCV
jgi:hypothetical protein